MLSPLSPSYHLHFWVLCWKLSKKKTFFLSCSWSLATGVVQHCIKRLLLMLMTLLLIFLSWWKGEKSQSSYMKCNHSSAHMHCQRALGINVNVLLHACMHFDKNVIFVPSKVPLGEYWNYGGIVETLFVSKMHLLALSWSDKITYKENKNFYLESWNSSLHLFPITNFYCWL